MNVADLWKYELRAGSSKHPAEGACLFDAGMWLVYGKIGDNPPCSCPIIRAYGIGLNDAMDNEQRQKLKPFILRIVGNRDLKSEKKRLHKIILETARLVLPLAAPGIKAFEELRLLPYNAAYKTIEEAAAYAGYAATTCAAKAAAYAAADAGYAAKAATYAAEAAAEAAATAAKAAAYAATDCASDMWNTAIHILDETLKIGKQSPEFNEAEVIHSVRMFEEAINGR